MIYHRHARLILRILSLAILLYGAASSFAQERPTMLVGHGTLSGSILPLWVGVDAKLFEKHGLQVRPIYLPRAAGRPALLAAGVVDQLFVGMFAVILVRQRRFGRDRHTRRSFEWLHRARGGYFRQFSQAM